MIQGRVYFPTGQAVSGKTVKVNLESVSAFGSMSTVADQDGVFRFTNLTAGDYTVVVDAGSEYEKVRESVTIEQETRSRSVQVAIQLRPKVDSSNPLFAGVPEKALEPLSKRVCCRGRRVMPRPLSSLLARPWRRIQTLPSRSASSACST